MAKARTAKQRAALRKAQLASARKRRRGGSARRKHSNKKRVDRAWRIAGIAVATAAVGVSVGRARSDWKAKSGDRARRAAHAKYGQPGFAVGASGTAHRLRTNRRKNTVTSMRNKNLRRALKKGGLG